MGMEEAKGQQRGVGWSQSKNGLVVCKEKERMGWEGKGVRARNEYEAKVNRISLVRVVQDREDKDRARQGRTG